MTALVLSTIATRTRRHTQLTKREREREKERGKTDKPDGEPVLCQRKFSSVIREVFYTD
jgi:hypothetical protein